MLISRYDTHHLGHSTDGSCTDSIFSSCFRRIIWNRPLGPSTAARCSSSRSCSRAVSSSVIPVPQTIKKRGGSGAPCCAAGCTRHRSAMRPTPRSGSAARSRPREPWPPWAFTPRGIRPALHRSGPGGMSANPAGSPDLMPAPWHSCTTNLRRTHRDIRPDFRMSHQQDAGSETSRPQPSGPARSPSMCSRARVSSRRSSTRHCW